jgi:Putative addiction module component
MNAAEKIYQDALVLPAETRVELTERLVASLADDVPAEIQRAHIDEVRKRIAQVESGEVELIPGDEALARVRNVPTKQSATAR